MRLMFICALLVLSACSKEKTAVVLDKQAPPVLEGPTDNLTIPNNSGSKHYRIALTGNSHIVGIGALIEKLVTQLAPNSSVETRTIGAGFLDDSVKMSSSLEQGQWTHIILQGQKYSQSRKTVYPTVAAELWIANAKAVGTTPILFPEHPQRGDITEAEYVHGLHLNIVQKQTSCIAPVGLVWDRVQTLMPHLTLHHSDGNHAADLGQYLTALVFAEVITGVRVDSISFEPINNLSVDRQLLLAQAVSEVIYQHPACDY